MVIKVSRNYRGVYIVRRMLYGTEFINILVLRHDHQSSGVLTRRPFYSGTALHKPVHLRPVQIEPMILHISLYISERGLVGKGSYCSRLKDMSLSEKLLGIGVRPLLVLSGKVKVDIRFLVSVKAKERLKRYVVSVLFHHSSAFWAGFVWHIHTGTALHKYLMHFLGLKVGILAVGADVMGRQSVYLRYSGHIGNKR